MAARAFRISGGSPDGNGHGRWLLNDDDPSLFTMGGEAPVVALSEDSELLLLLSLIVTSLPTNGGLSLQWRERRDNAASSF